MANKKILIVEDDQDLLRPLTIRLKASNYDTISAEDAVSAIHKAVNEKPDVILLDLGLPAGNGFTVMERLKGIESVALTPVIVITARSSQLDQRRAFQAGAKAFFTKPFENDELLSAIREVLAESGEAPE